MWVRNQDKTILADIIRFEVHKNIGGKNKGALIGYSYGGCDSLAAAITLGNYETPDKAMDELDRVSDLIRCESKGVYQIS